MDGQKHTFVPWSEQKQTGMYLYLVWVGSLHTVSYRVVLYCTIVGKGCNIC